MKFIVIAGAPAVGKSTLMKAIIRSLPMSTLRKEGVVVFHEWSDLKLLVLGDYSKPGRFQGTDTLAMNAQPQVVGFLQALQAQEPPSRPEPLPKPSGRLLGPSRGQETAPTEWRVLFEGDRLCNRSFLQACQKFAEVKVYKLFARPATLETRHGKRWDAQDDTWLKGRVSKVRKLCEEFDAIPLSHNSDTDTGRHASRLLEALGVAGGESDS